MSAHFSKFALNTYAMTPYFISQVPTNYPTSLVLQKCRAFRRLPPRLRELAAQAKKWMMRKHPEYPAGINDIERWYDDQGNELDPDTGRRLTDAEIDAQWRTDYALDAVNIVDVPVSAGGFADPMTWEEPIKEVDRDTDEDGPPTVEQLKRDIQSHGREATSKEYGIPLGDLPR